MRFVPLHIYWKLLIIVNSNVLCSTAVAFCAPNKNKTNPRENLEFVLFFTRDYFGLIVKLK